MHDEPPCAAPRHAASREAEHTSGPSSAAGLFCTGALCLVRECRNGRRSWRRAGWCDDIFLHAACASTQPASSAAPAKRISASSRGYTRWSAVPIGRHPACRLCVLPDCGDSPPLSSKTAAGTPATAAQALHAARVAAAAMRASIWAHRLRTTRLQIRPKQPGASISPRALYNPPRPTLGPANTPCATSGSCRSLLSSTSCAMSRPPPPP